MQFDPTSEGFGYDTDLDSVFDGSALLQTNGGPISYVEAQVGLGLPQADEEDDDDEEEEDEVSEQIDQTFNKSEPTFKKA